MRDYIKNYLFAEPSFAEGAARLFDFGGTLQGYNASETEKEADTKALMNDWLAVGADFRSSIGQYEQELTNKVS